jgi:cell fate (sporulation/competence/biofilm development) regulator YmcA (YheA/YmcA/DUF963 family)
MTQELNTKLTGFEERVAELSKRSINSGMSASEMILALGNMAVDARDIYMDMQTALSTKDAEIAALRQELVMQPLPSDYEQEIAELRGLLGEAGDALEATMAVITGRKIKNKIVKALAKLTAALAQKGGQHE